MSGPFVRKIQHQVTVSPEQSDGGWWPRLRELAEASRSSTEPLGSSTTPDANATGNGATTGDCPVCPHQVDTHDEIGTRFCAATAAGQFERGCVCSASTR